MSLFLFSLLLSVVLGGQNLAFPDYSLAGNRPSQKSCNTGSPVVLNLWISECPRKCQRSSDVLMSWASQPLTFLLCSSGLLGDLASLSLGLRHAFGLTATFCWPREIQCKMSTEAPYPPVCPERCCLHRRLSEPSGNAEHRCKILTPWSLLIQANQRNARIAKPEID